MNTRTHAEGTEYSNKDGRKVRAARREFINRGCSVSLIAFDPSRDVYAFDVYR